MARVPVVMPELGESVVEATLTRWHVHEGDLVQRDQTLAEVSTDKADSELPSTVEGRVARLLVQEGDTVKVKTPIIEIETEAAKPAQAAKPAEAAKPEAAKPAEAAKPPAPARAAEPVSAGAPVSRPAIAAAEAIPSPAPAISAAPPHAGQPPARTLGARPREAEEERQRTSPLVRRMAQEHGVDLSQIQGTGSNGRVTKQDVLDYLEQREGKRPPPPIRAPEPRREAAYEARAPKEAPAPREAPAPQGPEPRAQRPVAVYKPPEYRPLPGDEVIPFSRRRQLIAGHMVYSKQTSPHVPCLTEIDLRRVDKARKAAAEQGTKISVLAYVAAATVRAVRDYPIVNASVLEGSYVQHHVVNLGIAVDTPEGLVVPVIKRAEELSLTGITRAIADYAEKARAGTLTADELSGGTITLSNPGQRGNVWGAAIINQPQVAILRMGEIVKRPVVITVDGEDAIVIRPIMDLVLSYDHRIIDGVAGNGFLRRVKELLEGEPDKL